MKIYIKTNKPKYYVSETGVSNLSCKLTLSLILLVTGKHGDHKARFLKLEIKFKLKSAARAKIFLVHSKRVETEKVLILKSSFEDKGVIPTDYNSLPSALPRIFFYLWFRLGLQ